MREIKFRAWDEELKKMYDGEEMESREDIHAWLSYGTLAIYRVEDGNYEELKELQYTGLKDKNGVEIYEGDILAFEDDKFVWSVEYDVCCFVANGGEYNQKEELIEFYDWKEESLDVVIIGNIYEHPHLLEVAG